MASPTRILQSKQTTPLPSQFLPYQKSGSRPANIPSSDLERPYEPEISHQKAERKMIVHNRSNQLTGDSVKDYLRCHKSFLEDYLLNEFPVGVLQKILKRKTCRRETGSEVAEIVGNETSKLKPQMLNSQGMLSSLSLDILKGLPFKSVLFRLCQSTAEAAYADSFQLYIIQSSSLVHVEGEALTPQTLDIPIRLGDTIPGHVAATKHTVNVNLIKQKYDFKYPHGSILDSTMAFILSSPILTKSGDVIGVLELGRKASNLIFSEEDEEIIKSYLSWVTVVLDCTNIHYENARSKLIFNSFDKINRLVSGEEWTFQSIFDCIRSTVISLVDSENTNIFMFDKSGQDLRLQLTGSNLYDRLVSSESNEVIFLEDPNKLDVLSQSDIVFPGLSIIKRVADYVAKTGEVLSLNEVSRKRFIEVDNTTAADNCKTILSAPMKINEKLLGVIVALNKRSGCEFTPQDKDHFMLFCEFSSLVLSSCKAHKELTVMTNKCKVINEVLEYHRAFPEDIFQEIKCQAIQSLENYPIHDFGFDTIHLHSTTKAQLAALMFSDLVDTTNFDKDKILRFCLTVSKNYRSIPYHNWEHAFSVAHCMYCVITGVPNMFTESEKMGFFVACLCHDLDHRGTNSSFLSKTKSPLADLYGHPVVENHHFSQGAALLQMDGIDIFSHLNDQDYFKVLSIIRKAIMASDIMQFFKNRETMLKLKTDGTFNWDNSAHKDVAQRMLITMCDLNSTFKPWEIYKSQVDSLFEEFYNQGDCERALGAEPLALMDRNYHHTIPDIQISFIETFSLASSALLEPILPHVQTLREGAEANIARWREMVHFDRLNKDNTTESETDIDSGEFESESAT